MSKALIHPEDLTEWEKEVLVEAYGPAILTTKVKDGRMVPGGSDCVGKRAVLDYSDATFKFSRGLNKKLAKSQRRIILYAAERLPYPHVAKKFGVRESAVAKVIYRAKHSTMKLEKEDGIHNVL